MDPELEASVQDMNRAIAQFGCTREEAGEVLRALADALPTIDVPCEEDA